MNDHYNANAAATAERYEKAAVDRLHDALLAAFPERGRLLEIGCGSGRDAAFMEQNGFDVLATDGSRSMLSQAARLHPELNIDIEANLLQLPTTFPYEDASFDGVYAVAVLMHLQEPDIAPSLKEIYRILKPSGRLFFSVTLARDDINAQGFDEHGRRFTILPQERWIQLCHQQRFRLLSTFPSDDSMHRSVKWLNLVFEKGQSLAKQGQP